MRRSLTRLLAVLLVGAAGVASAKWDVLGVEGVPNDVQIADAGYFAVATSTGAYAVLDDGGVVVSEKVDGGFPGSPVTAFIDASGCLGAVPKTSTNTSVIYANGCASTQVWSSTTGLNAYRQTGDGTGYWFGKSAGSYFFSPSAGFNGNDWGPLDTSNVTPALGTPVPGTVLAATRIGSTDVAVFTINQSNQRFGYVQDSGTIFPFGGFATNSAVSLAVVDPSTALDVEGDGGVSLLTGIPGSASYQYVPTPPSSAVAFSPNTDLDGAGFGLLAPLSGGTFQTTFPDPTKPGQTWVASTAAAPAYQGVVQRISCLGAQLCVAVTNNPDAGNVVVYENAAPPAAEVPALVVLDAGTSVSLNVDAGDPDGDAIKLLWSTDAGSAVTVTTQTNDGRSVQLAASPSAMVCSAPQVDYAAEAIATDGWSAHRVSYPVTVRVPRVFSDLATSQLGVDAGYVANGNAIAGTVDASGLNCPADRGLHVDVSLTQGPTVIGDAGIGAPGAFSFPLSGCAGGTFTLTSQLSDQSGTGPGPTDVRTITATPVPAMVGAITTPTLVARCGQPVQAQFSTGPAAGGCSAESFTWSQVSGPALVTPTQTGATFDLETVSEAPKDLIGQSLTLAVAADAGNGTSDQAQTTVTIGAEPFVSVSHSGTTPTDPDLPRTVEVAIDNPTGCDLPATTLIERLGGLQYVEGSATLDGQPVPATVSGDALRVDGIPVEASGHHVLRFSARPSILGDATLAEELTYRDVPVSQVGAITGGAPGSVGCGCDSAADAGGVTALLSVLLLIGERKRRNQQG